MGKVGRKLWPKSGSARFTIVAGTLFCALSVAAALLWDPWLHPKTTETASNSETLRNTGLLIGGVLALMFAGWRAWVAERQAAAAQGQTETAQKGLLNERYQRGAEMLGNSVLAVRLGGIYALQRLAEEHPEEYHLQIMQLLSAFVRNPTASGSMTDESRGVPSTRYPSLRDDVQAAITAISQRSHIGQTIEWDSIFALDLGGAYLVRANLRQAALMRANLHGAHLIHADLTYADLAGAELTKAELQYADLTGATCSRAVIVSASLDGCVAQWTKFDAANLTGSNLSEADLIGADFSEARLFGVRLTNANVSGSDFRRQSERDGSELPTSTNFYAGPTSQQLGEAKWEASDPPLMSESMPG